MSVNADDAYTLGAGRRYRLDRSVERWQRELIGKMTQTAIIKRRDTTTGELTSTYTDVYCRIRQPNSSELRGQLMHLERVDEIGLFPADTDLRINDVVTIDGKNYDVKHRLSSVNDRVSMKVALASVWSPQEDIP